MTWRPPWWVAPLAVGVAVLAVVWALNGRRDAAKAKEAAAELHRGQVADLNAAHEVQRRELLADLVREALASAALADELARIKAVWPTATPIATAHGSTPWKPVGPAAGSAPPPPPAGGVDVPPSVPASPACPPCRLWVGDEVQVRAGGAALETDLGNVAVAAAATVWRRPAGGGPEEELHAERLKLDVSVLATGRPPGWGAGALLVGGRGGWWVGPAASPPPLRVLGLDLAVLLAAGAGPGGEWGAAVGGLVRW